MAGGFSFCGTDIAKIGLEYAPELEDTYVYKTSKARIHEETYDGHDGGYFYGSSLEPKEFILRCYFEEKEIDRGLMAKVYYLFKEGKSGRLVFDRRPWCYYYATVTDLNTSEISNYMNGVIKVTMKAYYPFARSDIMYVKRNNKDFNRIMANTALFDKEEMIPPVEFCQDGPITETTSVLLANPGTQMAHVGIEIAGNVGKGVIITNETTGQSCKFVAMDEETFDGEMSFIYMDGLNGKTSAIHQWGSEPAFLYHDEGFIQLAPGFPARRNLQISVKDGEVLSVGKLYDRNIGETRELAEDQYKGKYIWLGKWCEITGIGQEYSTDNIKAYRAGQIKNEHQIIVADVPEEKMSLTTMICNLNKITIQPISTMKLTRLKFVYKPTFS